MRSDFNLLHFSHFNINICVRPDHFAKLIRVFKWFPFPITLFAYERPIAANLSFLNGQYRLHSVIKFLIVNVLSEDVLLSPNLNVKSIIRGSFGCKGEIRESLSIL